MLASVQKVILYSITAILVLFFSQVSGKSLVTSKNSYFIENKGQIIDQDSKLRSDVRFVYNAENYKLILKDNGFSHEVLRFEKFIAGENSNTHLSKKFKEPEKYVVYSSRIDVELEGANPHPEIIAEDKSEWFNNYYTTSTPENGIREVYGYSKVTYRNIYNHIDFVFYALTGGRLKYDIIVHGGGKMEDVKMVYKGMEKLSLQDGKLKLETRDGNLTEDIPTTFIEENGKKVIVDYELKESKIFFKGKYKGRTLVIDPTLNWATYYGGSNYDICNSIILDSAHNTYVTGTTMSTSSIATSGAYQTSFSSGIYDAFIAKFDNKGSRKWSTYYGGGGEDYGISLTTDKSKYIYVSGFTSSTTGIATSGAYQTTYGGGNYDAFLVKFNLNGLRQWGTYFGGSIEDRCNGIAIDNARYIYIVGQTASTSGIASSGTYQTTHGGGSLDAFLVKFDSSGLRKWATYYGGTGNEGGICITIDSSNNVYLCGNTTSSSGLSSSGAYQTSFGGAGDAFLAKFASNGSRIWGTYYGGLYSDGASAVTLDKSGNVYLAGYTSSLGAIASSGAYQTSNGGGNFDAFLVKFASNGSRIWGTYYGGTGDDYGISLSGDGFDNTYLLGYSNSNSAIASSNAYQISYGGKFDAFLVKFNRKGFRQWGTYYGGVGDDYGFSVKTDSLYNILFTGGSTSSSAIASTNAYQGSYSGGEDGFIVKFFEKPFPDAGIISIDSLPLTFCKGSYKKPLFVKVKNFSDSFKLDSVYIGWSINGSNQIPHKLTNLKIGDTSNLILLDTIYLTSTSVKIKVWTYKPNGISDYDNTNDTLIKTSSVNPLPNVSFSASDICVKKTVSFSNNSTISSGTIKSYFWKFDDGTTSTLKSPQHVYNNSGIYKVWLIATSDKDCKDSSLKTLTIYPAPTASFIFTDSCISSQIQFKSTSSVVSGNIASFQWNFGDNTFSTAANPIHSYSSVGAFIVWLKVVSDKGCVDSTSRTITIHPLPVASFNSSGSCINSSVQFTSNSSVSSGSISSYYWDFGDQSSSTKANPTHSYSAIGTYTVSLKVVTDKGCIDSTWRKITIISNPTADFSFNNVCSGNTTSFTDKSTTNDTIWGYFWKFGDNTTSTLKNPSHMYPTAGKYSVKLKITSFYGCLDSISKQITVFALPNSQFTANKIAGRSYKFSAAIKGISQYEWNFGDGANKNASDTITHTYSADGNYTITLKTTDSNSCSSTSSNSITIATVNRIVYESETFRFDIYPNPSGEKFTISYELASPMNIRLSLLDLGGREIGLLANSVRSGSQTLTLNPADYRLMPGIYILRLQAGNAVLNKEIVLIK